MVCLLGLMGFFVVPIIPLSYQIGCEVAFPIGEAQITGLLNGGSLIWAFIADSILTAAVGFGSKAQSTIFLFIVIIIIMLGTVLYFFVAINLKRKHFEDGEDNSNNNSSPDRL
jgi:FLVCR family feline leukemia virus subgroup C receptor-related protein